MNYINFMQAGGFLPAFALDQTQQQASPTFQNTVKDRAAIGRQLIKERYDQVQQEADKSREIITAKDPRTGKEIRMPNPKAGFVSGTDPVGEFIVADAVLSKPLDLIGKGLSLGFRKAGNAIRNSLFKSRHLKPVNKPSLATKPYQINLPSKDKVTTSVKEMEDWLTANGFEHEPLLAYNDFPRGETPRFFYTTNAEGNETVWLAGGKYFYHPKVKDYANYVEKLFKRHDPFTDLTLEQKGMIRPFTRVGGHPDTSLGYRIPSGIDQGAYITPHNNGIIRTSLHEGVSHNTDDLIEAMGPGAWRKYDWYDAFRDYGSPSYDLSRPFSGVANHSTKSGTKYTAWIQDVKGHPELQIGDEAAQGFFSYRPVFKESINPWESRATMNEIRYDFLNNPETLAESTLNQIIRNKPGSMVTFPGTGKSTHFLNLAGRLKNLNTGYGSDLLNLKSQLWRAYAKEPDAARKEIFRDMIDRLDISFKRSFSYPVLAAPVAVGASVANSPVQSKQKGGTLDFESFQATLPENLRIPDDRYDMQRYWELNGKPKDFEEALSKNMFALDDDGLYHAYSTVWNQDRGVQEWVKRKDHPTAWMENSATALNGFQDKWRIQNDPEHPGFLMYTKKEKEGGSLNYLSYFKDGGIHIKKSNKGKFTDYCGGKVTSECIEKGKHSKSAAVRKRATFAANARKWKH